MMRSLYSGVAGLKTHQTKMDVIGNNIANVNTTAYKSSSIVFSDLMSQTTQRASGPNATTGVGGVNARQIGLGVKSGAININITGQGSTQSTGNPFDVMINGDNFFVVNNGQENFFTRDGSFFVDAAGNLAMTSLGYNVMGWQVDEETGNIKKDTVSALRIMSAANMTYPPEATSQAYLSGIIDKHDTDVTSANGRVVNLNFFDSLGYSYTAKFTFRQSSVKEEYSMELDKILDSTGAEIELDEETKRALFGDSSGGMATQQVNTKVSLKKGYTWDTATSRILSNAEGAVADLSHIFDATGNILSADTAVAPADPDHPGETVAERAQRELDALAAAYGYEGSTEDFLNLCVGIENNATPAVKETWSVRQLLGAQMGANYTTGATGDNLTVQRNFASLGGGGFTSDARVYYGHTVTFDAKSGYLQSVDGLTTDFTVRLNLNSAGLTDTTVTDETNPMGNFSNITIDLSEISMFDNKGTSTIGATSGSNDEQTLGMGAGRRLGDMIGVSIDKSGLIYASYDNGMTRLLGQIATAAFPNASGLEKQGDNLYSATMNSGDFDGIGEDITAGGGYFSTGQLEMSNVDLSSEFTEMITTQRGFQANSRIITVSDTLLEELTNLKR
ncbi:MAG: flagellar hook-basal body complex protein [Firmicutes bacterium]|nr:flagellar hook-basal body complex protein [Bacillota bacterium]